MLNQRLSAAQGVAKELFPAEETLENALLHTSRMMIAAIEGRRLAKLPITMGQAALERTAAAASHLVAARAALGEAHVAFRQTSDEIGLRALSYGDLNECPPASGAAEERPSLSVVPGSKVA